MTTESEVVALWAKKLALRIGGPDEGWGLWADWLHAFLGDIRRAHDDGDDSKCDVDFRPPLKPMRLKGR